MYKEVNCMPGEAVCPRCNKVYHINCGCCDIPPVAILHESLEEFQICMFKTVLDDSDDLKRLYDTKITITIDNNAINIPFDNLTFISIDKLLVEVYNRMTSQMKIS